MSRRKTYSRKYDLSNQEDLKYLGMILAPLGIHLEVNLFDQPYIILEDHALHRIGSRVKHNNEASHS